MAITEHDRHDLYVALEAAIGPEQATTLMEHLPPVGWADVATKHDLAQLQAATSQDFAHLQTATSQDFALVRSEMRAEMADLRTELRGEMAELRTELRDGLAAVRTDLGADIADLQATSLRDQRTLALTLIGANAGMAATVAALAFAAARLV